MDTFDAFTSGVETGGLFHTDEIKTLVCYLLQKIDAPLSVEQVRQILVSQGLANYFDVSESVSELLRTGNVTSDFSEQEEVLHLTATGREALGELLGEIPRTVREKALSAALEAVAKAHNARQTQIEVEPCGSGYHVTFHIADGGEDLMRITLYAVDMIQVNKMKDAFLKDPVRIYSGILASFIV
ncbi:MAG: DUF4364 family protein [Clostridia bacterium]|nr:DUF4364 family protein [Clostridia bacterium]